MPGFQRTKQCVIFEPVAMGVAELFISRLEVFALPGAEVAPSLFEDPALERDDGAIVDSGRRERIALAVL